MYILNSSYSQSDEDKILNQLQMAPFAKNTDVNTSKQGNGSPVYYSCMFSDQFPFMYYIPSKYLHFHLTHPHQDLPFKGSPHKGRSSHKPQIHNS